VCCSVLQRVAVCCSVLHFWHTHITECKSLLKYILFYTYVPFDTTIFLGPVSSFGLTAQIFSFKLEFGGVAQTVSSVFCSYSFFLTPSPVEIRLNNLVAQTVSSMFVFVFVALLFFCFCCILPPPPLLLLRICSEIWRCCAKKESYIHFVVFLFVLFFSGGRFSVHRVFRKLEVRRKKWALCFLFLFLFYFFLAVVLP